MRARPSAQGPIRNDFVTDGRDQALKQMVMGAPERSRQARADEGSGATLAADAPARPAFRELFEQHFSFVWNTLKRLGVQERDLEDLAQQVFFQVHEQLAAYDPMRPLRPWLFGFAYNAASNYRALARHRVELSAVAPDISDPQPAADELLITRQELALAEQALARVPFERRAVLLMHEVQGHSMPEIARTLDLPLNTAYSRLRLARQDYEQALRRMRARGREP